MDSCFALLGALQHCVAKICNANPRANAHKLQNDPFTISSSALPTHLRSEKRGFGVHEDQVSRLVSRKKSYVGRVYRIRPLAVTQKNEELARILAPNSEHFYDLVKIPSLMWTPGSLVC